jgi:hypothetical protein
MDSKVWKSKIDAAAPIGANDDDYITSIQQFYDRVYAPLPSPKLVKDADVRSFLSSATFPPGIDKEALATILLDAFDATSGETAAAKEARQITFTPSSDIQPSMGVDEVYVRKEDEYIPTEPVGVPLPEGGYAPIEQQETPRHPGTRDYKTTSWTSTLPYDVCESGTECTENVL